MPQFSYCYSAAHVILSSFEVQLQLLLQILITLLSCWYQLHRETFKECTTSWACDSGRESPTQSLLLMIYGKCTSLHFTSFLFISLHFISCAYYIFLTITDGNIPSSLIRCLILMLPTTTRPDVSRCASFLQVSHFVCIRIRRK